MLYRPYGKTNKMISALSFGSTRFAAEDLNDPQGLEKCANLIIEASSQGVNYFDIATNYSKSQCEKIYNMAFQQLKNPYYVTSKSSSFQENTADQVFQKVENSLKALNVSKIDFFYMWSIMDEGHYRDIMKKGGAYEGALRAKTEGLIDHIVFSNHATPDIAIKIIEEGAFEGVTLSYNLLNFRLMQPVIDAATKEKMGITVMNPLAGGIIPQNPEFFASMIEGTDDNIASYALKFIYANQAITSIISGIRTQAELKENIAVFDDKRLLLSDGSRHFDADIKSVTGLCTGCGYCANACPKAIPIPELMQSYNMSFFNKTEFAYGKTDKALVQRIGVLRKLEMDFHKVPENALNPCIECGACESICTQHLPIVSRIKELYQWIDTSSASKHHHYERLKERIMDKNYKKVGFYSAGGYTIFVINQFKEFFGEPDFDIEVYDSNPNRWGDQLNGYEIKRPADILKTKPDAIIISNFIYSDEIYNEIKHYEANGIEIIQLHNQEDVPWVF